MRIGFIGAGKVGFTLGKYLEQNLKKETKESSGDSNRIRILQQTGGERKRSCSIYRYRSV